MIYNVINVSKVIDGDSVNLNVSRLITLTSTEYLMHHKALKCRLITLDTPERGQSGYLSARHDVAIWLDINIPFKVQLETYGEDSFGRELVDIYATDLRNPSLSQWMLTRGWLPWVRS